MEQPFVTIGIPVYNVGRFIELALRSVLAQTYTNFELIITDDGSTDNTIEEIRKSNDPRVKLIVDGENRGISYRLNQQIDLARGKYFVRMDGDDIMFPDRVEKEVAFLEQHPEIDVVGAGTVIIDDGNNIIGLRQGKINCTKPEDIVNNTPFIHPTVCGRTEFFKKYKYEEKLCGVEDNDLWLRGVVDHRYAIINEPLLFYRDPLKFKLKTYIKRKMRGCRKCVMRWDLFKDKGPAIRYFLSAFVKSSIAVILCVIGKDKLFVVQRNSKVEECDIYQKILSEILK